MSSDDSLKPKPTPLDYRPQGEASLIDLAKVGWILLRVIAIVIVAIWIFVAGLVCSNVVRHYERYDQARLKGMTEQQVRATLGPPVNGTVPSVGIGSLFYQKGRDPDAVIHFEDGRVVRVELLR